MRKWLFLLSILLACPCWAATRYVAQTAGTFSGGTNCNGQTAISATTFNGVTNSGDDINWLCGAISTTIAPVGSGTSGHPILLNFDSGATLSQAFCPATGCLRLDSRSYWTVDGMNVGIIQSTANGSGLANAVPSAGIEASPCTNCIVQNLTIENIYFHSSTADNNNDQTLMRCIFMSGSNWLVTNNTMHDAGFCVYNYPNNGDSNVTISNNNIYNVDHGVTNNAFGSVSASNFFDFGNHIHDFSNWDTASDAYHHDGVHDYGTGGANLTNVQVYNNLFDGNPGTNFTSMVYMEKPDSSASLTNALVYNNVMDCTQATTTFGCYATASINIGSYNNTVIGANNNSQNWGFLTDGGGSANFKNNIVSGPQSWVYLYNSTTSGMTLDYNVYAAIGGCGYNEGNGTCLTTIAAWRTFTGSEANSQQVASANLAANYVPNTGSVAINGCVNLTSLGITALNSDKNGSPRPASGAWTCGAFNSAGLSISGSGLSGSGKAAAGAKIQ